MYTNIKLAMVSGPAVDAFDVDVFVQRMLEMLDLIQFADKPSSELSGGNRRKLSVGIALLSSPPVLFLDEPSTGMDPQARRFMWALIASTMQDRAVILTTHLMEECEALCSRIGIMIAGNLACLGSPQHLRSKFGNNYQLEVKLKSEYATSFEITSARGNEDLLHKQHANNGAGNVKQHKQSKELFKMLRKHFSEFAVTESQAGLFFKFHIKKHGDMKLSSMFQIIESAKKHCKIDYYSISETDLEYIFMQIAKNADKNAAKSSR
jgi:ABC-type multidrug transport system ATPase subunit